MSVKSSCLNVWPNNPRLQKAYRVGPLLQILSVISEARIIFQRRAYHLQSIHRTGETTFSVLGGAAPPCFELSSLPDSVSTLMLSRRRESPSYSIGRQRCRFGSR